MKIAIPLEPRFRLSLHMFRWGFHVKLRRWHIWRHFVVKYIRGHSFGGPNSRREIWVGSWRAEKGVRHSVNGFQLRLIRVRHYTPKGPKPSTRGRVPFYPQNKRLKDREFEVL